MKKIISILLLTLNLIVAKDYYVSKTGIDTALGTQEAPVLTIQKAIDLSSAGDNISISQGIYQEDLVTKAAGTSEANITINGNGSTVKQINFKHANVRFTNFNISGKNMQYQAAVWFWPTAHYCKLDNCVIDNGLAFDFIGVGWKLGVGKPFSTDTASNCIISNNVIKNVGSTAMLSICGDDNIIQNNTIIDGAEVDFVRLVGRRNVLRNNTFKHNYLHPDHNNHPDFIQCFGNDGYGSKDHIIDGNIVEGIEGGGLTQLEANLCEDIRDWTFTNNVFVNISNTASCTVEGIKYYNNLFYKCNFGNGGHPLSFGSRGYEARSVDPSVPAYQLLVGDKNSGELVSGGTYTVYMLKEIFTGQIELGVEYIVDGSSSGYVSYNGVNYARRSTFIGGSLTNFTKSGSMVVYKNGKINYNGTYYNHNSVFTANDVSTFSKVYDPVVRRTIYNRAHGAQVFNNIFLDCGDNRISRGWYGIAVDLQNVAADYNYVAKAGFIPVAEDSLKREIGNPSGWDELGLKWWEPHGINGGDPSFIDLTNLNFKLLSSSKLITAAKSLNTLFTIDLEKVIRGESWSVGPYQYKAIIVEPPPTPPATYKYRVVLERSQDGETWEFFQKLDIPE